MIRSLFTFLTTALVFLAIHPFSGAQEPDTQGWLLRFQEKAVINRGDLVRAGTILARGGWGPFNYQACQSILLQKGWIESEREEFEPVNRGELARLFFHAYSLPRTWTTLFGITGRYALMELVHRRILPGGGEFRYVSGEELFYALLEGIRLLSKTDREAPEPFRIRRMEGTCRMEQDGVLKTIGEGDPIPSGVWIETGPAGRLELLSSKHLLIEIGASTRVRFLVTARNKSPQRLFEIDLNRGKLGITDYNRFIVKAEAPYFFWMTSLYGVEILSRPAFELQISEEGSIEEYESATESLLEEVRSILESSGSGLLTPSEGARLKELFAKEFLGS